MTRLTIQKQDQAKTGQEATKKEISCKFILGLLDYLITTHGQEMAHKLLQDELKSKHQLIQSHNWIPYSQAMRILERAVDLTNDQDLPYNLAHHLLELEALSVLKLVLSSSGSPHDAYQLFLEKANSLSNIDHVDYLPGRINRARLIYRHNPDIKPRPHYCSYRAGLLRYIPTLLGLPPAIVKEIKCVNNGDDACIYKVRWAKQPVNSALLTGTIAGAILGSILAIAFNILLRNITLWQLQIVFFIPFCASMASGHLIDLYRAHERKARLIGKQRKLLSVQESLLENKSKEMDRITAELSQNEKLGVEKLNKLNERLNQINYELLQRNVQILREHEALIDRQEHEHKMAKSIQQAILLNEDEFHNQTGILEGTLAYQTADQYIGGDFYDYAEDGDRAYILVGDVSGHGLGAVQVVHSALSYFRSINKKHCPEKLMKTLNKYLKKDLARLTSYATAIYCVVYNDELHYINAAQRGGFVYKPDEQRFIALTSIKRPLGSAISDDSFFKKGTIQLKSNDLIILHTDGLVEARHEQKDEEFGSHRVEQLVREHYRPAADGAYPHPHCIKNALLNGIDEFQKDRPADDITLLVLKY